MGYFLTATQCPGRRRNRLHPEINGFTGAAKGVGKGMSSMVTKTGAGMFGLLGYTSQGIAKSLRSTVHMKTRKSIAEARHAEGRWLVENDKHNTEEAEEIITRLLARKGEK